MCTANIENLKDGPYATSLRKGPYPNLLTVGGNFGIRTAAQNSEMSIPTNYA